MYIPSRLPPLAIAGLLVALLGSAAGCRTKGSAPSSSSAEPSHLAVLSPVVPETVEPVRDMRLTSRLVSVNVFEPLVREDGGEVPTPVLAESWANPEPDTWLFTLRANATFHDGTRLTADDVVASFHAAGEAGSSVAGSLAGIANVEAADASHVRILTKKGIRGPRGPLGAIGRVLVFRKKSGTLAELVGTGPYRVASLVPGDEVTLQRFEGWWGGSVAIPEVRVKRYRGTDDASTRIGAGASTIVLNPPQSLIEKAASFPESKVVAEPQGILAYLAFQLAGPGAEGSPFQDVRVRRAVQKAVDVERLVKDVPGGGIPEGQIVPSGSFGHDASRLPVPRDLAGARALLAEAGHPNGFEVELDVTESNRDLAKAVARDLGEAGIRARVRALPSNDFVKGIAEGSSRIYVYSWIVGVDATEPLKDFFMTRDDANGTGTRNRVGYSSKELDAVLERALGSQTAEKRLEALHEAGRILGRDLPWVPLYTAKPVRFVPRRLSARDRVDGLLYFSGMAWN
ncbi:MAG: hypothetical protein JNK60_23600 [Acidobacteria bacterium]|nr:hypothetical protein [Acidobacteriota bacterium]